MLPDAFAALFESRAKLDRAALILRVVREIREQEFGLPARLFGEVNVIGIQAGRKVAQTFRQRLD